MWIQKKKTEKDEILWQRDKWETQNDREIGFFLSLSLAVIKPFAPFPDMSSFQSFNRAFPLLSHSTAFSILGFIKEHVMNYPSLFSCSNT